MRSVFRHMFALGGMTCIGMLVTMAFGGRCIMPPFRRSLMTTFRRRIMATFGGCAMAIGLAVARGCFTVTGRSFTMAG